MNFLLILVMLTTCATGIQDLSGKMFNFPMEGNRAQVRLNPSKQNFEALTLCHRSFTDLTRDHALFSAATPSLSNGFLVFWDARNKEMEMHVQNKKSEFGGLDYKPNMWHSICSTWDAESGLVQIWFDGQPSIRKFVSSGANISGQMIILLGQDQDTHGGGFDAKQSFVGMTSDVHMWDYVLSPCEIQNYVDEVNFTPGNVLNWAALDFQITDKVLIENKVVVCH